MSFYYPCCACDSKEFCGYKYNRNSCARLQRDTILFSDIDKEMFREQMRIMFTNIPPNESAKLLFDLFYAQLAANTSDVVCRQLIKMFKEKEPGWFHD